MTSLHQRMIDAEVQRGFAARTQETCLTAVSQLARHHHRSPDLLSDKQVQACLLYLLQAAARRSRSPSVNRMPVPYSTDATSPTEPLIWSSSKRNSEAVNTTGSLRGLLAATISSNHGN